MKRIFPIITFAILLTSAFSQDEIFLKNGKKIIAEVDTASIIKGNTSVRIKKRYDTDHTFLNLTTVNFIRSWNGILLYPRGVAVNTNSGRIHLSNVSHLPEDDQVLIFDTKDEAIKAGYELCHACFDTTPSLSDLDIELELTKETILAIQNSNEIMYEHEKLPVLQKFVDKVLLNWPEKLKGYDYRIQIIRDKSPNAMAVAGGNLYFTTGLIDIAETDSELEAIVAHEIAHVERRHSLREYKAYLKKQAIAAVVGVGLGLIAANNSKNQNVQTGAAVAALSTVYALEFAQKGYARDLEQEADMFAQIYLKSVGLTKTPMLSSLDKIATYTGSRIGFVPSANAYSSHPDVVRRMNQIKYGELINYDSPVKFALYKRPVSGKNAWKNEIFVESFIELDINYVYSAPSSEDPFKKEIMIAGTVNNNNPTYSFKLDELKLNFVGTLGVSDLKGLVDVVVPRVGSIDFVGRVQAEPDQAKTILGDLRNRKIIPFSSKVSAVIIKPGEEMKSVKNLSNQKTAIVIK